MISSRPVSGAFHPADQAVQLRFDGYLNPNIRWANTVEVKSGEISHPISVQYDPVGKSLVIRPEVTFRPGLGYTVRIIPDEVVGLSGTLFTDEFQLDFVSGPPAGTEIRELPRFDEDIAPIFARECGCHGPEDEISPTLTLAGLSNQPSWRQPDWPLVTPGRPLASYLVLRMLPSYPGITGPTKTMDADDVRTVIRWIRRLPEN